MRDPFDLTHNPFDLTQFRDLQSYIIVGRWDGQSCWICGSPRPPIQSADANHWTCEDCHCTWEVE